MQRSFTTNNHAFVYTTHILTKLDNEKAAQWHRSHSASSQKLSAPSIAILLTALHLFQSISQNVNSPLQHSITSVNPLISLTTQLAKRQSLLTRTWLTKAVQTDANLPQTRSNAMHSFSKGATYSAHTARQGVSKVCVALQHCTS